ncbi:MAG TPA: hypothetical protein VM008_06180 [Phycisphaerae bacterium]|nr:hypothetical protein [Phycisphaerae bacterium]
MTDVATGNGPMGASGDVQALREKAAAAKEAVMDLGGEAKRYASHRLADAKDKAAEWAEAAKERAGDMNDNVIDFVRRRPFTSIGIAVGIGFVAGLLLKRR